MRILALLNNPAIEMDGIEYARIAEAITSRRFGEALGNVFSPGYPLFISLVHLVVPDVELAGRIVSVAFGTLLIWLSFFLGKRVLKDETKAIWLSFLVAFHPHLIWFSGEALSESVATLLFTLAIFSFYVGWQEGRRHLIACSGLCLAFTYLTRPEYLVFYAPLILILLWKRRLADASLLFLPMFALGSLYILYLHGHTGLWIVSNKAVLSPFVSLPASFANIPLVCLCFLMAISPLVFAFAVIGCRQMSPPYRGLLLLLIIFHIASLSLIGHATKRYSVEFVPLCLISAVEGIYVAARYLSRVTNKQMVYRITIFSIIASSVFVAYKPIRLDRVLQKKAGLFLLSYDSGSTVAARKPIVAFYSKGNYVDLLSELSADRSITHFSRVVTQRGIRYLIFDEKVEKELAFLKPYLARQKLVWSAGNQQTFIRIYRLL